MKKNIKKVVVVGGGTAGWITASLLVKLLGNSIEITLVESDDIPTVGVGEATIPAILTLHQALGLDEREFLRETQATMKLGIQFENWRDQGHSYMHTFGYVGKDFPFCAFSHFWTAAQQKGVAEDYWDYSLNYQAARKNKFTHLSRLKDADMEGLAYAYHFDAGLYAKYLRRFAERLGVVRIEGMVNHVAQCPQSGDIEAVHLSKGEVVGGDLFVDCSGMRGLLIEQTLNVGYDDWSHWLPNDSAIAGPTASLPTLVPYTRSIAQPVGWQWQIPLQHRVGNGYVYSSKFISDDEAKARFLENVQGDLLAEPRLIRFKTGTRRKHWHKNVVSIGLSSGFLEPLESTSIHLIQAFALQLIKFFPHQGISDIERDEFNRRTQMEMRQVRDFIILHYVATERRDTEYWRFCAGLDVPDSLRAKMELFRRSGKVFRENDELFSPVAWQQVLIGQGVMPEDFHPIVAGLSDQKLKDLLASIKLIVNKYVDAMPEHETYIQSYMESLQN
ncbi:MAG: hypothetical protein RL336_1189 [Pseudomonadota bacterium]|jgi:tryptophan halogenase